MTEYEAACLMDATARLKAVPLQSRMAGMISAGCSGLANLCIAGILPPFGRQNDGFGGYPSPVLYADALLSMA